ncbi:hypothetical protein [Clostridium argentinense]
MRYIKKEINSKGTVKVARFILTMRYIKDLPVPVSPSINRVLH